MSRTLIARLQEPFGAEVWMSSGVHLPTQRIRASAPVVQPGQVPHTSSGHRETRACRGRGQLFPVALGRSHPASPRAQAVGLTAQLGRSLYAIPCRCLGSSFAATLAALSIFSTTQ